MRLAVRLGRRDVHGSGLAEAVTVAVGDRAESACAHALVEADRRTVFRHDVEGNG